jgi:hypothetical protein
MSGAAIQRKAGDETKELLFHVSPFLRTNLLKHCLQIKPFGPCMGAGHNLSTNTLAPMK